MKSALKRVLRNFLKNSTLHGFKYLNSPYCCDRFGWVLFCVVSLCCAGALCAAFWARFLATPALLTMKQTFNNMQQPIPKICVCPTPEKVTELFVRNLNINTTDYSWLSGVMYRILRRENAKEKSMLQLQDLLSPKNLTLVDALTKFTPPCDSVLKRCVWQNVFLPCDVVFKKDMTPWGFCCSMEVKTIPQEYSESILKLKDFISVNQIVSLVLNCSGNSKVAACEFVTKYKGEEWTYPIQVSAGTQHRAKLVLSSVTKDGQYHVIDNICASSETYSLWKCLVLCKERICGCADPMRPLQDFDTEGRQICSILEYNCLVKIDDDDCPCLQPCTKVTTKLNLVQLQMDAVEETVDPFYQGLNKSEDAILDIIVQTQRIKSFHSRPTETWLTLMSSLGGVFNMFLGVGFLSALEVIYLLFVQVPIALRKSAEINVATTPIQVQSKNF